MIKSFRILSSVVTVAASAAILTAAAEPASAAPLASAEPKPCGYFVENGDAYWNNCDSKSYEIGGTYVEGIGWRRCVDPGITFLDSASDLSNWWPVKVSDICHYPAAIK